MEETTITNDRLNDGADKLAKAIRQGHRATSDVYIPVAFEEIRLAVEERFEQIERLEKKWVQAMALAMASMEVSE